MVPLLLLLLPSLVSAVTLYGMAQVQLSKTQLAYQFVSVSSVSGEVAVLGQPLVLSGSAAPSPSVACLLDSTYYWSTADQAQDAAFVFSIQLPAQGKPITLPPFLWTGFSEQLVTFACDSTTNTIWLTWEMGGSTTSNTDSSLGHTTTPADFGFLQFGSNWVAQGKPIQAPQFAYLQVGSGLVATSTQLYLLAGSFVTPHTRFQQEEGEGEGEGEGTTSTNPTTAPTPYIWTLTTKGSVVSVKELTCSLDIISVTLDTSSLLRGAAINREDKSLVAFTITPTSGQCSVVPLTTTTTATAATYDPVQQLLYVAVPGPSPAIITYSYVTGQATAVPTTAQLLNIQLAPSSV